MRLELQMALDSKDSDIEQLRCQLTSLSVHSLDSTSISSGNDPDTGDGYPGRHLISRSSSHTDVAANSSHRYTSRIFPSPLSFSILSVSLFSISVLLLIQADCVSDLFLSLSASSSLLLLLLPFLLLIPALPGPAQCALLTLTPQSPCPSPTSAHTNLSASTPGLTFTPLVLSLTLTLKMKKKNMTGSWSGASILWPSPTIRPLSLTLQVTLHGASKH